MEELVQRLINNSNVDTPPIILPKINLFILAFRVKITLTLINKIKSKNIFSKKITSI